MKHLFFEKLCVLSAITKHEKGDTRIEIDCIKKIINKGILV